MMDKAVRMSRERVLWRGVNPRDVVPFTSAPFSSSSHTVSGRLSNV